MPTSSPSSCRDMYSRRSLRNPRSWLSVAPIASPPDFTTTCQRKVGAWKRPRGLRGPSPGQSTASHRLSHLHLYRESRASWRARGSIGGWGRSTIVGCWEHRGWNSTSTGLQGASAVSMGWGSLKSLLRGPLAGPGRLWAAISPEGVWRVLAASGEARWARTWSGIGLLHSRQRSGSPQAQSLELGALGPFPPLLSHAPFGTPAKKLFLAFFPPFLPNFGDDHAP